MITLRFLFCVVSFVCVNFWAANSWATDLRLQAYPNARVMFHSEAKVDEYVLALGSFKKLEGAWRPDHEERLSGNLVRTTLELPEGHEADEGFKFYLEQIQNLNVRELFHCKARDCGTSNSWANNHFKIIQLYGLDQFQQYGAYEVINSENKPFYVAIYSVRRGNKRVYVQVEVLQLDKASDLGVASSPESLIRSIDIKGYYVFPDLIVQSVKGDLQLQIKAAHLKVLVNVLKLRKDWELALVGHDYAAEGLTAQQKNSLEYAEQLKAILVAQGIDKKRLSPYGLGSLAPAGKAGRSARVELVKLPKKFEENR